SRSKVHVADIMYESGVAHGDPVASYLDRLQRKLDVREKLFPDNGYAIVPKNRDDGMFVQALSSNWAYSYISGDYNPIHTNPYISDLVGLPGTITHGMWTSASTRSLIERYVANDNPERVRAFKAQFVGMVLPGDKLETKLRHVGMKHGRMLIAGETFNADGKKVLVCTAEVDQAPTAY
ncbi:fatty acid synthase alpha subunit Lsd1, partial [Linderina pennispora]